MTGNWGQNDNVRSHCSAQDYQRAASIAKRCPDYRYHTINGCAPRAYSALSTYGEEINTHITRKGRGKNTFTVCRLAPRQPGALCCRAQCPPQPPWEQALIATPQMPEGAHQSPGLLLSAPNQQPGKVLWLSRVYLLDHDGDRERNGRGSFGRA